MTRRVLVDDCFFEVARTGIARVWWSMLGAVKRNRLHEKEDLEILVLNRTGGLADVGFEAIDGPHFSLNSSSTDRTFLTELVRSESIDLMVSSYYTFALGVRNLAVGYDAIPEVHGFDQDPGFLERRLYFNCADALFSISHWTERALQQFIPQLTGRPSIVGHPGVDPSAFLRATDDDVRQVHDSLGTDRFLLMVGHRGTGGGYKNGDVVFRAFAEGSLRDFDMVVVGGESVTEFERESCRSVGRRIIRLEPDDDELRRLYSASTALVYPSLSEGFGLPPLESLAVGTPVVTTMRTALPESVGHLSNAIGGFNSHVLAKRVAEAADPTWIGHVREAGPDRARRFTWDAMARQFISACVMAIEADRDPLIDRRHELVRATQSEMERLEFLP